MQQQPSWSLQASLTWGIWCLTTVDAELSDYWVLEQTDVVGLELVNVSYANPRCLSIPNIAGFDLLHLAAEIYPG